MEEKDDIWAKACGEANISQAADAFFGYARPEEHLDRLTRAEREWLANRAGNVREVRRRMLAGWKFSPYKAKVVHEPKRREIHYHSDISDSVAELAVMRAAEGRYMAAFSPSVCGAIKGRGLTKAAKRLREMLDANPSAYFVQTDCRHYYASVDRERLKRITAQVLRSEGCASFMARLIDSYPQGIPIGIPSGHFSGNLMLTPVDRWLDECDVCIGYIRNMDDIVALAPDKAAANRIKDGIVSKCASLGLEVKPNWRVAPVRCGIDAFGYVTFPGRTRLRRSIRDRMRRRARSLRRRGVGGMAYKKAMASHYGWCLHGDCRRLLQETMGDNLKLFGKMKINDRRPQRLFFGMDKERFTSITELDGAEVLFLEVLEATIRGEEKLAIKFCPASALSSLRGEGAQLEADDEEVEAAARYTITKSAVMKDRLSRDAAMLPFRATISKAKGKYWKYE